jgi:hypothetical protein
MHEEVLLEVELADRHRPTGETRHFKGGEPLPPPRSLRIVRYADDGGIYLLYLDPDGQEQTDTWHQTVDDAQRQAAFEFEVQPDEWQPPAGDA